MKSWIRTLVIYPLQLKRLFRVVVLLAVCLSLSVFAAVGDVLKEGHPERYTVQEGDTLWDIASMFLTDAWRWPEIWDANEAIENPHLIFPGDMISLTYVDGSPRLTVARGEAGRTVKLSPMPRIRYENDTLKAVPQIRVQPLQSAIPAIPLDSIASLLNTGRIVERTTLRDAPYILAGHSDRLIFGPGDKFYARGDWPSGTTVFGIFREGEVYLDPETKDILGYEAREVGLASITTFGDEDVFTMTLDSVKQDVRIGDRLLPTEERRVEPTFYPAPPETHIEGVVMTVLGGLTQVGKNDVVAINRGAVAGLGVGNVLEVYKEGRMVRDRISRELVRLPQERAGLLMVFRLFDKMAYGLVLETEEPLSVGDAVISPPGYVAIGAN